MNISSVIVIPKPGTISVVSEKLAALPGVEVALAAETGQIILTIETDSDRENVQMFEYIAQMDHVLSASMVYHQQEDEPEAVVIPIRNAKEVANV